VPSKTIHLTVARDNERLAAQLNPDISYARGWASTMYFYAALHYVEAFFSVRGVHSADHRTRDGNLCRYNETMEIYDEFCELKNISTTARYFGRYPAKMDLSVEVVPALQAVKAEMEKYL
jgi:hypothetical protein